MNPRHRSLRKMVREMPPYQETPQAMGDAQHMASLEEGRLAGEAFARDTPDPEFVPKTKLCEECDTYIPVEDYERHVLDTHCTRAGCSRTSLAVGDHHPKHCPLAQPF